MSRGLAVRRAQSGDLSTIVELRLSLLREYADHPMYSELRPDAERRARELFRVQLVSPNEAMFLAETGRTAVGVLRCVDTQVSPLLLPEHYCYVSSVFVRPGSRRQGVLRALLAAGESWCAERGIDEMRLHNTQHSAASAAWSALGFEVVEEVRRRTLRRPAVAAVASASRGEDAAPHVAAR